MLAVIIVILIIWAVMWAFYRFMYPRPPKSMMPKKGDVITPRFCNFCGNSLAEYRGVLEAKPVSAESGLIVENDNVENDNRNEGESHKEWFFCNYEHQADFHAGKVYNPHA
ncbi:hypothetical protein QL919_01980 [Psychrobacter sp. APC 3426]|uniref:hypothetical protein n=1 Tax=Psychrobacter sp. APC 3426 TaxID=3035177 RepID=UPI0025B5C455|nr:hypothetical protein [Psychrobacter sp. APC 3426]MDN3397497.1 hypothetical protein [Psychrobacter sp. APC 3426]